MERILVYGDLPFYELVASQSNDLQKYLADNASLDKNDYEVLIRKTMDCEFHIIDCIALFKGMDPAFSTTNKYPILTIAQNTSCEYKKNNLKLNLIVRDPRIKGLNTTDNRREGLLTCQLTIIIQKPSQVSVLQYTCSQFAKWTLDGKLILTDKK